MNDMTRTLCMLCMRGGRDVGVDGAQARSNNQGGGVRMARHVAAHTAHVAASMSAASLDGIGAGVADT